MAAEQNKQPNIVVDFLEQIFPKVTATGVAITLSVIVHLVLLSIHFEPELKKLKDKLPTLEVKLVNAKTKSAPSKADVLAQANLDRGGNTDQDRQMTTALPSIKRPVQQVAMQETASASAAKAASVQAKEAKAQKRVTELEKQAQELMTKLQSMQKIDAKVQQQATSANPKQGKKKTNHQAKSNMDALSAAAKEMDRLEALIAKQQSDYQKRPKRKFIGARAKEYRFAQYVERWRQKVEKVGNLNYPEAAKARKLYGKLQMTISIKADGTIEEIIINRSSGQQILDDAAKRIVQLSAPFAVFPKDIKRDTDILSITRTFTFTRENALTSEGADQ